MQFFRCAVTAGAAGLYGKPAANRSLSRNVSAPAHASPLAGSYFAARLMTVPKGT